METNKKMETKKWKQNITGDLERRKTNVIQSVLLVINDGNGIR